MTDYGTWGRISEVDLADPKTYQGRFFLTFDVDWAHDDVIRDTYQLVSDAGVASTWFVTHDTPSLDLLRSDPNVELGIHPNFNKLLEGDSSNGSSVEDVLEKVLEVVPDARSVRAHSLMQSSRILDCYAAYGLTHDATHIVDRRAVESLSPWLHWNGITRVPLIWEDDLAFIEDPGCPKLDVHESTLQQSKIRQINFHPIHVFLNTEHNARYESSRAVHHEPTQLISERFDGKGIRELLVNLIGM